MAGIVSLTSVGSWMFQPGYPNTCPPEVFAAALREIFEHQSSLHGGVLLVVLLTTVGTRISTGGPKS